MRIIGGAWRGRRLVAPSGTVTRPTSERLRQAIFDMLLHAAWGGPAMLRDATVLDAFAGTGAMGLEALSRGAGRAVFMECDANAMTSLHENIAACRAGDRAAVLATDVLAAPLGEACGVVFLDPPYRRGLVPLAVHRLRERGWIAPGALVIAECERDEVLSDAVVLLAQRPHGAGCVNVWREM